MLNNIGDIQSKIFQVSVQDILNVLPDNITWLKI